ncbi:M23 family metallopeptidase [Proluteimonas luteida]|uniref:M23 family metallopeptidase n=1 Tax=Proluteimonas luteida TaxID=2878685 RepID=UPI003F49D493
MILLATAAVLLVAANVALWLWRGERAVAVPEPVPSPAAVAQDENVARDLQAIAPPDVRAAPLPPPVPTDAAILSGPPASPAAPSDPSSPRLIVPVAGIAYAQLSDTFGDARGDERRHEALDIMAAAGTPVLAVADGTIEKLFDSERGGLTIYQFEPGGRYAYYYAHLQDYAPGLAEGATVRQGQVIGHVGSTGNADPAAPHLHFAIFRLGPERRWWEGEPVNPYPLLGDTPVR